MQQQMFSCPGAAWGGQGLEQQNPVPAGVVEQSSLGFLLVLPLEQSSHSSLANQTL